MGEPTKTPPFLAWGLYRERVGRNMAMEWRELGPVFVNSDGNGVSGGFAHFKSIPVGWNHRIAFRRYEDGPPPLPILRPAPKQKQQPTGEPEDDQPFFGDEQDAPQD
jgi:hypothetical protein